MPPYDIQPTPNPNSLKFMARDTLFDVPAMVTGSTPEEAGGNELAMRLLSIDGIANVFIVPQFLTITKSPGVQWDDLLPSVEELIASQLA